MNDLIVQIRILLAQLDNNLKLIIKDNELLKSEIENLKKEKEKEKENK